MEFFFTTLNQMLILFMFIVIGFTLNRLKILPKDSDVVISRLENYVLVPALIINTFMTKCTVQNLADRANSIFYSLFVLGIGVVLAVILAPFFTKRPQEKGIYKYSIAIANFGFVGNSVVQGIFGDETLFDYMIFTLSFNLFIYTIGIVWLTGGQKKFTVKSLLNPMFISTIIGGFLGLTQIPLPKFLAQMIVSGSGCYSPLAMILTGFVIGGFDVKSLFMRKNIYVLSVLRLVVFPLIIFGAMKLINAPADVIILTVCAVSMPLGLNTIVFPAAYGGDEKPGASMAMISSIISIATIPVMLSVLLPM
jgi:predicted permease